MEALTLEVSLADKTGRLIPHGIIERVTCLITDELAAFKMKNGKIAKRFAMLSIELDKQAGKTPDTIWNERNQQFFTKYPGKSKEEIQQFLVKSFESMGGKIK